MINNNNNNNKRDKVVFLWVIVALLISASMTFAKTLKQVQTQQDLERAQQELDFPSVEQWPAGGGQDAVWVNPDQDVDVLGNKVSFDTPIYKVSLDSDDTLENQAGMTQPEKNIGQMDLLSW